MKTDAFSGFHPVVSLSFFAAAIGLTMFLMHPVFQGLSLLCACCYLGYLQGPGDSFGRWAICCRCCCSRPC